MYAIDGWRTHFRTSLTPTRLPHSHFLTPGADKTRARLLAEFPQLTQGGALLAEGRCADALRSGQLSINLESVVFCSTAWSQQPAGTAPRRPRTLHSRRRSSEACMYGPRSLPRDGHPAGSIAGGDAQLPVEEDAAGPLSVFSLCDAGPHSLHRTTDHNLSPPRRCSAASEPESCP